MWIEYRISFHARHIQHAGLPHLSGELLWRCAAVNWTLACSKFGRVPTSEIWLCRIRRFDLWNLQLSLRVNSKLISSLVSIRILSLIPCRWAGCRLLLCPLTEPIHLLSCSCQLQQELVSIRILIPMPCRWAGFRRLLRSETITQPPFILQLPASARASFNSNPNSEASYTSNSTCTSLQLSELQLTPAA